MIKKILYIVVGALVLAAIIALLWLWLAPKPQSTQTGQFGSAGDRTGGAGSGAGQGTNLGSQVNTGTGGSSSSGGGSSQGGGTGVGTGGGGGVGVSVGTGNSNVVFGGGGSSSSGIDGVTWVSGTGGGLSGSGRVFTASEINQISGTGGSLPNFSSSGTNQGGNNGFGLLGILGAGAGCAAYAAFQGTGEAEATARGGAALAGGFVLVYDAQVYGRQAAKRNEGLGDCLARTIAKAAIQQMTASIVNWINSGFNGQPSFVTNFEQFFNNVGDQAAGEFIKGSGLAFLCSPFRPQVRLAIAQAYANRGAQSCSLTSIVRNVNGFMNGNFSAGGWPGFLSFTTMPTNNPYGAYVQGQVGLAGAQNNAIQNAQRNVSPGGFISVQKCTPPGSKNCKVVTPGAVVEDSLKETLRQPFLANQLAKSFDEIISALFNQLVTRTLYSGLAQAGTIGVDPAQQAAMNQAQALLNELQASAQTAQQYGAVKQGAIRDIQFVQQGYNEVFNCWNGRNPQSAQAQAQIDSLQARIDLLNADITRANNVIAIIQDLQTELSLAMNPAGVTAVTNRLASIKSGGTLITQTAVTFALQDRETLQTEMNSLNTQATQQIAQCRAST